MDWIQIGGAFGAAAAGAYTMLKTMAAKEKRQTSHVEKERRALFLNGDKEEVIRQLERLMMRDRETDHAMARIESSLRQLNQRLDRAGISP